MNQILTYISETSPLTLISLQTLAMIHSIILIEWRTDLFFRDGQKYFNNMYCNNIISSILILNQHDIDLKDTIRNVSNEF